MGQLVRDVLVAAILFVVALQVAAADDKIRVKADPPSIAHDQQVEAIQETCIEVDLMATAEVFGGLAAGTQVQITVPAHGKIGRWTGNRVVYRPDPVFSGNDAFTYVFTDSSGTTYTAKVMVHVRGFQDPVVATNVIEATAGEKRLLTVADFIKRIVDPKNPGKPFVPELFKPHRPAHGQLESDRKGSYTYQPDSDYEGRDTIPYMALSQSGTVLHGTLEVRVRKPARPAALLAQQPDRPHPLTTDSPEPPQAPTRETQAPAGLLATRSGEQVTLGPAGCPTAVVGQAVWDVRREEPTGVTLHGHYGRGRRLLSPDGRWFIASAYRGAGVSEPVVVWSTQTGAQVGEGRGGHQELVGACWPQKWVLTAEKGGTAVDVWDLDSGRHLRDFAVARQVQWDRATVSEDGRYLAFCAGGQLVVHDTATGLRTAVMQTPELPGIQTGSLKEAMVIDSIVTWCHGLRFSPDGQTLACYATKPDTRMLCWSLKGEVVLNHPLDIQTVFAENDGLEWSPDGTIWLLDKTQLCDRATCRVMRLPEASAVGQELPAHFLDQEHILVPAANGSFQFKYRITLVPQFAAPAPPTHQAPAKPQTPGHPAR